MEIPMNRKKTVPKRLMVFVMGQGWCFSLSSISSTTISSLSCPLFSSGLVESRRSHGQPQGFPHPSCRIAAGATAA